MKVDINVVERAQPTLLSRIGIGKGKPPMYELQVQIVFTNEECFRIKEADLKDFSVLSLSTRKYDRETDSYVDGEVE